MSAIAAYALRESLRRRVFHVVLVLSVAFLALHATAATVVFDVIEESEVGSQLVEQRTLAGSTLVGLAMFATLFLGTVLAVFLTLGAVRGDAERGLLQPLLVRPVGRTQLIVARFLAAATVCVPYAVALQLGAVVVVGAIGDWWPDRVAGPVLMVAGGVAVLAALSLLGSVLLSPTANGIAAFMVFGAGLTAGLLGQIGEALNADSLEQTAGVVAWALPFEALYQAALDGLTADSRGLTSIVVELGPFGGAEPAGPGLVPWTLAYLAGVLAAGAALLRRRDL